MAAKRQVASDAWVIGSGKDAGLEGRDLAWVLTLQQADTVPALLGIVRDWLVAATGLRAVRFIDDRDVVRLDYGIGLAERSLWRLGGDGPTGGFFEIDVPVGADVDKLTAILGVVQPLLVRLLAYEQALAFARRDALTGLYNRTAMEEALARELELVARHRAALSLIVVDIDAFKQVNDRLGHRAGDAVLRQLAQELRSQCRGSDQVFRYAGDEFVVGLPQTDAQGAESLARRVRQHLAGVSVVHDGRRIVTGASIGVATARISDTLDELFERADADMYRDKRAVTARGVSEHCVG